MMMDTYFEYSLKSPIEDRKRLKASNERVEIENTHPTRRADSIFHEILAVDLLSHLHEYWTVTMNIFILAFFGETRIQQKEKLYPRV
jgi:hypothetical protein